MHGTKSSEVADTVHDHSKPVGALNGRTSLLYVACSASKCLRAAHRGSCVLVVLCCLLFVTERSGEAAQQWTTNQLPAGCIAWWQAENNMLDSVDSHNWNGDSLGFFPPDYASGRRGQAWLFNGTNQSVRIPDVYPDLDGWTQFTLEAWVNISSFISTPGGGYGIFSKVGNNRGPYSGNYGFQFAFSLNAAGLFCQFNTNGQIWPGFQTAITNLTGAVTTNVWAHVAATYDASAVKLYLNGVPLVTNIIGPHTIASTTANLRISMDENWNVPFPGRIDDARIYLRGLSADEIAYLFLGPPPLLAIRRADPGTNVVSWAAPGTGWVLEQTSVLNGSLKNWAQIPPPYQTNATEVWAALPRAVDSAFYRLRWVGIAH
jgi:hypothetical protein